MDYEDYVILKAEIDTDPKELGYADKTDQEVANLLNEIGLSGDTVLKSSVSPEEMLFALDYDDLAGLLVAQLQILTLYTNNGDLDINNALIQKTFKALFGAETTSRANLLALAQQSASRAQVLCGKNVKYWDVARARGL